MNLITCIAPIVLFIMAMLTTGCSKTKEIAKVEHLEKIELPFSDKNYRSNGQFLRFVQMHESMPNTTRLMAPQADHWVHLQQPEIVCQAVQSVLERIGRKNK